MNYEYFCRRYICLSFQPISPIELTIYFKSISISTVFSTSNLGIDRFAIGHGLVQVSSYQSSRNSFANIAYLYGRNYQTGCAFV